MNEESIGDILNELNLNHTIENVLHTLAFLAGSNNLGISRLSKLLTVFQSHSEKGILIPWNEMRWDLLHSYISGYNYNTLKSSRYDSIKLIGLLLMHPKEFIFVPIFVRNDITKYLIKTIIGSNRNMALIINWLLSLLKKYSN